MDVRAWVGSVAAASILGVFGSGCGAAVERADGEDVESASFALEARSATAVEYDASTASLTVALDDGSMMVLRYGDDTSNVYIGNPELFPEGPCGAVAKNWDKDLDKGRSNATFMKHLSHLAHHGCGVSYDAAAAANADGSFDLLAIQPAP